MTSEITINPVSHHRRSWRNRTADLLPPEFWRRRSLRLLECRPTLACVVAFHRVSDQLRDELTFPVRAFQRLCKWWRDHYTVLSLAALYACLQTARPLPARALAITFDDGYVDNAAVAAPILQSFGLPATFFVTTGLLGTQQRFPWDSPTPATRLMSEAQLRQLERDGFMIGAHTQRHLRLSRTTAAELYEEIVPPLLWLQARLRKPSLDFSFPFGGREDCGERERSMIRAAGYRTCYACYGGGVHSSDDPFYLQRLAMSPRFHASRGGWERAYARLLQQEPRPHLVWNNGNGE